MSKAPGFFDLDERFGALSSSGDPLERLAAMVDFEIFRVALNQTPSRSDSSKGGRPPMDPVMLFKILVLQAMYGLSDEQAEFQIRDRRSFMRFHGLGLADRVPDYATIWRFGVPPPPAREALVTAGAMDDLFVRFDTALTDRGYLALGGRLIDASIIEAPRQRLTVEEKQRIRVGLRPDWPAAKARHEDIDAALGGRLTAVPLEDGSSVS